MVPLFWIETINRAGTQPVNVVGSCFSRTRVKKKDEFGVSVRPSDELRQARFRGSGLCDR